MRFFTYNLSFVSKINHKLLKFHNKNFSVLLNRSTYALKSEFAENRL